MVVGILELVIVVVGILIEELVMVIEEFDPVELEAANTGDTHAALIKIPNNTNPLRLILTKDGSVCLYISNY